MFASFIICLNKEINAVPVDFVDRHKVFFASSQFTCNIFKILNKFILITFPAKVSSKSITRPAHRQSCPLDQDK